MHTSPHFLRFFRPAAIDGPRVVLNARDYLKASPTALPAEKYFIDHAYTWMQGRCQRGAKGAIARNIFSYH